MPLVVIVAGRPLLLYYCGAFARVPLPVTPRTFGRLLLVAAAWTAVATIARFVIAFADRAYSASLPTWMKVLPFVSLAACLLVLPVLLKYQHSFRHLGA